MPSPRKVNRNRKILILRDKGLSYRQLAKIFDIDIRAVFDIVKREKKEIRELEKNLNHLSPREQKIISMRFGLRNGVYSSLGEIAQKFGVSRERIRQIEANALKKIKKLKS